MSSPNYHWTRQDLDMCPRVDICPQSNVSSNNFHWTQTTPQKYSYCTQKKKNNNNGLFYIGSQSNKKKDAYNFQLIRTLHKHNSSILHQCLVY